MSQISYFRRLELLLAFLAGAAFSPIVSRLIASGIPRHAVTISKSWSTATPNIHQWRISDPTRAVLTEDEIAQAAVLQRLPHSKRQILKINSKVVAKIGPDLEAAEFQTMIFLRNHTNIPIPRVLNAYEKDGCRYILMDFVEGDLLSAVWDQISCKQRAVIVSELKNFVRQMRQIPAPEELLIGSVTGGPAIDRRSLTYVKGGPFTSEAEFNKWQLAQLTEGTTMQHRDIYTAMHRTDHKIVFSHGDLGFHNVIVRDGHVASIIDWEFAGWFPEHWDYIKTASFLSGTEESYLACKEIFDGKVFPEYFLDLWFTRSVRHGGF